MSVIIAGQAGASWGLNPQNGMIAQSSESDASIEENPSKNADGEVEMTSFYNPTRNVQTGGVWLGGGANLGQAMPITAALLGDGGPSGTVWCVGIRLMGACTEFVKFHLTGKQYDLF